MIRKSVLLVALAAGCGSPAPVTPTAPPPSVSQPPVSVLTPPAPPTFRLPETARPTRYDLALWLDPKSESLKGTIGIDLDVLAASNALWLDSKDLVVDAAALDVGTVHSIARVVPGGDDYVGFVFDHPLAPGKARLTVAYHGKVDRERSRGVYSAREADGEPYIYSFFEPTDARRAFPCFDEPSYKVPWKVTLHVPSGDVALGNAPVAAEHAEAGGKVVELAESKPLPSYLVALVVGPFDVIDAGTAGHFGTPLRFIVPRGRGAETAYAASVTPKIVGLLEDYFGMPYPYGKLDVAVNPRYWGTMEHPGLVALGQPITLITPAEMSVERQVFYTNIAAHELAHYWFGDYVTTAWWDDVWLNEALGTWMDEKITHSTNPAWRYDLQRIERAFSGMSEDALPVAKKIRQPIIGTSDIDSAFDNGITYFKGQAVTGMFEAWMTPDGFRRAIRAYMTAHAFGSATSKDFFAALDAEKPGAGAAFATFVDQPGVPFVEVETSCAGSDRSIKLRQRRYEASGTHLEAEMWKFPVCVRYPNGARSSTVACTFLDAETASIPIQSPTCPAWVMGNADGHGYYHVHYTVSELRAILAKNSGISSAERIDLLREAAALVASGDITSPDALALVPESATDEERHVVAAGAELTNLARDAAMNDREAAQLARFFRKTYGARAAKLGLERRPDDGAVGELLRPTLFSLAAYRGEDASLRKKALDLAFAWLKDPSAAAPELAPALLSAAATTNDAHLFDAIVERAKTDTDRLRVYHLLSALGRFTSPVLAKRADDIVAGTSFDLRDSAGILHEQLEARATQQLAWDFEKASFDALAARMRSDEVDFELVESLSALCDERRRAEVKAFFDTRASSHDGLAHSTETVTGAIGQCAATFEKNRAGLDAFLSKY